MLRTTDLRRSLTKFARCGFVTRSLGRVRSTDQLASWIFPSDDQPGRATLGRVGRKGGGFELAGPLEEEEAAP